MESDDSGPKHWYQKVIVTFKNTFNPIKAYHHVVAVVKKHGLVIGAIAITFEIAEHFVLPGVLVYTFGPEYIVVAGMPAGELIFYPLLFKYLS